MRRKETHPDHELPAELVVNYLRTFISRFDRYPLQRQDGCYVAVNQQLTVEGVAKHLYGGHTIGAYALDANNHTKWLCYDADDENEWQGLLTFAMLLDHQDITAYLEPSRRGGHLWLFLEPMPASDARRFGKHLISHLGLDSVELYPKQDRLQTGPGSLVRLPLGKHQLTGKRYHFITRHEQPLAPTIREQIRILGNPKRVPIAFVENMLKTAPEPKPVFPTSRFQDTGKHIIGDTPSERIKNRMSVLDFVSQYVQLNRGNRGLCPFHDDHVESFSVNTDNNYWHCFAGCGGGSVIDFWMKWRSLHGQDESFTATITDLAQMLL